MKKSFSSRSFIKMITVLLCGSLLCGSFSPMVSAAEVHKNGSAQAVEGTADTDAEYENGSNDELDIDMEGILDTFLGNDKEDKKIDKEETVYVFADSYGKAQKIKVSDHLKNPDKKDKLSDESKLSNIENVKGDETFSKKGDDLTWEAAGNEIYYTGETDEETPVGVKLTYFLDGKEVKKEDIAGKSGKVKIRVDYDNKTTGDDYVPFVMITGLLLNGENFSNVEVENGEVIADGNKYIAVGLGIPGLEKELGLKDTKLSDHFEITADASDFELDMTLTAATTGLLDNLPEDAELEDIQKQVNKKANEFKNGVNDLKNGINEYTDGVAKVKGGVDTLKNGTDRLSTGAGTLSDGALTLTGGADKLSQGTLSLKSGAQSLKNGTQSICDGAGTLSDGATKLSDGAVNLYNGTTKLSQGAASLNDGANALSSGASDLSNGIKSAKNGADQLKANGSKLYDGSKQISDGLSQLNEKVQSFNLPTIEATDLSEEEKKAAAAAIQQTAGAAIAQQGIAIDKSAFNGMPTDEAGVQSSAVAAMSSDGNYASIAAAGSNATAQLVSAIQSGIYQSLISQGIDETTAAAVAAATASQYTDSIQGAISSSAQNAYVAGYANSYADTSGRIQTFTAGLEPTVTAMCATYGEAGLKVGAGVVIDKVNTEISGYQSSIDQLKSGIGQLSSGSAGLTNGISEFNNGVGSLSAGLGTIDEGSDKLVTGAKQLSGGTLDLKNGADTLNSGAKELSNGALALSDGAKKLSDGTLTLNVGAGSLLSGTITLSEGAGTLSDGARTLSGGAKTLADGAYELNSGVGTLKNGVDTLDANSAKLCDGAATLYDVTKKLVDTLEGKGEDLTADIDDLRLMIKNGNEYESFTGKADEAAGSVRFIIKTEGVEKSDK